jgi:hypothetical protein
MVISSAANLAVPASTQPLCSSVSYGLFRAYDLCFVRQHSSQAEQSRLWCMQITAPWRRPGSSRKDILQVSPGAAKACDQGRIKLPSERLLQLNTF